VVHQRRTKSPLLHPLLLPTTSRFIHQFCNLFQNSLFVAYDTNTMFPRFTSWTSTTTSLSTFNLGSLIPLYLFLLLSSLSATNAFTWRFTSAPTQCEETSVIWDGGTAPYKLLMLPLGFKPQGVETRVIFERTIETGNQEGFIFPFPAGSE
jgi:hypothetical protein